MNRWYLERDINTVIADGTERVENENIWINLAPGNVSKLDAQCQKGVPEQLNKLRPMFFLNTIYISVRHSHG